MKVCEQCDGQGEVMFNNSPIGDPQCDDSAPCPSCHGTGETEHDPDDPYDVPGGLLPLTASEQRLMRP